ncbi:MAG: SRPBCC domain-containing protein [Actinomycetota bacterium]
MTVEVHEQTIEAPAADVWGFMVDPAALSAWFGADAWLEPVIDGPVLFRFADGSVRRGVVEAVERPHLLTWRWREHRGAGFGLELGESSRVTIELEPVAGGTLVRITESMQATAAAS